MNPSALLSLRADLSLGRPRLAARLANNWMALRMFSAVESSVEASSSSAAIHIATALTFNDIPAPYDVYDLFPEI